MVIVCSNMVVLWLQIGKEFDRIHKKYSADKGLKRLRNLTGFLSYNYRGCQLEPRHYCTD